MLKCKHFNFSRQDIGDLHYTMNLLQIINKIKYHIMLTNYFAAVQWAHAFITEEEYVNFATHLLSTYRENILVLLNHC